MSKTKIDSTTKKYATTTSKPRPSDLGTGTAARAAKAIKTRQASIKSI